MKKIFKTPTDFEVKAELYFLSCAGTPTTETTPATPSTPLTLPGLAFALGFCNTRTLLRYRNEDTHKAFHDVAQRAALRVEAFTATQLYNKQVNVSGPIFSLKAQEGWKDKDPGEAAHVTIKIDGVTAAIL